MKRTKTVQWEKQNSILQGRPWSRLWNAAWESVSLLVLIFVAVSALSRVSDDVRLEARGKALVTLCVLVTVFVYEGCIASLIARIEDRKKRRVAMVASRGVPALLAGGFLFGYYLGHSEEMAGGFFAIADPFVKCYNRLMGVNVLVYGADPSQLSRTLGFLVLCSFLAFYFPSPFGKRKWQFLLLPAFAAASLMLVGLAPNWSQTLIMAAGALMLSKTGSSRKAAAIIVVALFIMIFGALGLIFQSRAEWLLEHSPEVKEFETKLEKNLSTLFAGTVRTKNESVANSRPKYNDAKVMTVRVSKKPDKNIYFKEFCGAEYEKGKWISKDEQFLESCKEAGFDPEQAVNWLTYPLSYENLNRKTEYQITYNGFLKQNMLLPYGVKVDELDNVRFRGDGIATKPSTQREQTFYATNEVTLSLAQNTFELAENLKTYYGKMTMTELSEEQEFWDWYHDYVNDTYMDAPDYKALFPAYRSPYEPYKELYSYLYRTEIAQWIQLVMQGKNSVYSWNLDELKSGEDAIEHFLKYGRKGYCIHFASAAVMLLRNYGIPARYVSGYVVHPSAFEEQEDGTYVAEVIDRNAHAWVEFYLDYYGWFPVEMTPGYSFGSDLPTSKEEQERREKEEAEQQDEEESSSDANEQEITEESEEETEVESTEEEPEESSEEREAPSPTPRAEKGQGNGDVGSGTGTDEDFAKGSDWILIAGVTGFMILAFAFLLYEVRRSRKKQLEHAIRRKYYKGATMIMNHRVYKKLRSKGKLRNKNCTDRELGQALREVFGGEWEADVAEYLRIVKAAAFSQERISKEECKVVWKVYRQLNKS